MSRKSYLVLSDFSYKNVVVEAGSVIEMLEAETKYLMHALMPAPAEPVAEMVAETVVKVEGAVEAVAEKVRKRIEASLKAPVDGAEA
ncbi:hypothetical protein [Methylobacterium indicum]|uniref:Uncharacterized protein n=1 Tax=Methylobacterium indicum TaxID=1775910 RepID=A0A8H9CA37_9HYPH|nr:hypothetical protein [Methylobacterium indicum]BCM87726.1 hypothetical protein mvi_61870 [Methylobacterium indicum]